MTKGTIIVACLMAIVLLPDVGTLAQECLPGATQSAEQRARRQAAVRFVQQVNAAQARRHAESGRYVPLVEIGNFASVPVGFVPRLTVDGWGYALSLKDLFDPCGFSLFSDQTGTVYEGRPIAPTD